MSGHRAVKTGPTGLADEAMLLSAQIGHKIVVRVSRPPETGDPLGEKVFVAAGTLSSLSTNTTVVDGRDTRLTLIFEGDTRLHIVRGDTYQLI